jgi:Ca2+-binding EF-hand superfamily protein
MVKRLERFCVDHIGVETPTDDVLKEMFDYFDKDNNGTLDKQEFKGIFALSFDNYGAPMSPKDVDRLFEKFDRDRSGRISYDEFAVLILSRLKM